MILVQMSDPFYCMMLDHLYDDGFDIVADFPAVFMGGEL